jgi:hypothetical protein
MPANRVIVVTRQRGTGRESGVPTQLVNASVFSLRNSKIARVEIVSSREEALALAGLAEPG